MPRSQIDVLLNLVPGNPSAVLSHLRQNHSLASQQDDHGYSLLHAASSYRHQDLIRALIEEYKVDPNIADEDHETPLFASEVPQIASLLLELGADVRWKNEEGLTAEDKIEAEGEFPLVAALLRSYGAESGTSEASNRTRIANEQKPVNPEVNATVPHPPRLPDNVKVNIGTMAEPEEEPPDPEFRRRIEELAAREDFQSEEGQLELRNLVQDAVAGLREGAAENEDRQVRRRVEE